MRDLEFENSYIMGIRWSWVEQHFPHRLMIATNNFSVPLYSHVCSHFCLIVAANYIDILIHGHEQKTERNIALRLDKNVCKLHEIRNLFLTSQISRILLVKEYR
jgi:hypothetical protein